MRVLLLDKNKINKVVLPEKYEGVFAITDDNNNIILNIEGTSTSWQIQKNDDTSIYKDENYIDKSNLAPYDFYDLDYLDEKYTLYVESTVDATFKYYSVPDHTEITVGSTSDNIIAYETPYYSGNFKLIYENEKWTISSEKQDYIYLNGFAIKGNNINAKFGDTLFIQGLRINLYKGLITVNNPKNIVKVTSLQPATLRVYESPKEVPDSDSIKEVDLYTDNDYFFKTPRMRRFIEHYDLKFAPPPAPVKKEGQSLIVTLGPAITMALTSLISSTTTISNILKKESTIAENIPQLIVAIATLCSSLLWPNITKLYTKRTNAKKEKERQKKYGKYLQKKEEELKQVNAEQGEIFGENLITPKECENIITSRSRLLWERRADQKDFLTVRVGKGTNEVDMSGGIEGEEFKLEEDPLKDKVVALIDSYKKLPNSPIGYSFNGKNVTALMVNEETKKSFMENILVQLLAFHSYDDVKIVFMVGKKNMEIWNEFKEIPHMFSNDKQVRFFATNEEDYKYIDKYLMDEIADRLSNNSEAAVDNESKDEHTDNNTYLPHYLIITDNYPGIRKLDSIKAILENKGNLGFSIACLESKLSRLPSECENYITVDKTSTILCTNINNYHVIDFESEIDKTIDIPACTKILTNVPIEFSFESRNLPTSLGFLEMFNVGKVEQLNTLNRWRMNDPVTSLRSQIGINDEGNPIYLDLHEKFHGPHGLVAGTTGSGKSEFIITYILSLVVNYSPNEVALILIDYKGGGLAGAFENKNLGLRLPHLAGTITNLDKSSLNRTLVSITSELERRQREFNKVREELGESTIDIYKYQKWFREGRIKEPMPHLFIISDEFSELKSQQPEFMADLVSTARIGRSLGIHLILATQKPSGAVSGDIWSNSKFKICLKVADAADSSEMLKKPDAAYITNSGRFYLQVGNDEIYVLGQSGWSGAKYIGSDTVKRKYDRSVSFIDDVGHVIKNNDGQDTNKKVDNSKGDELGNVLRYVCDLAEKENVKAKNLWLPAIPDNIYVDELIKKYNYKTEGGLEPLIGEYDAPSKQFQDKLTINLADEGNTGIFGLTGSNRELFLGSLIYSLCVSYTPQDVNIYVVDLGSETLRMYAEFPQVGDIVYVDDADKFKKLVEFLQNTMEERKVLFADYNADYRLYNKKSGKKVPVILFMLNNYDSFKENYANYEDLFTSMSRDCERYGIMFILTGSTPGTVFSKFRRNIHNNIALDMKEKADYQDLLGKVGNIYPKDCPGRGMIFKDMAYEFQTAQVADADNLIDFVKEKAKELNAKYPEKAMNIPVLPDIITNDLYDNYLKDITKLPIGMNRNNLKIAYYNFFQDFATIVTAKNILHTVDFIKTIIYDVKKLNQMVVLVDAEKMFPDLGGTVNSYVDDNIEPFILQFEQFLDSKIDGKNISLLVIIAGADKFREAMDEQKHKGFFNGVKTFKNVRLLLVDSAKNFKKFGFDDWFKGTTNNANGIWVGKGFADQNVLSVQTIDSSTREELTKQFAWVVKDREPKLIKIAGEEEVEEENEE